MKWRQTKDKKENEEQELETEEKKKQNKRYMKWSQKRKEIKWTQKKNKEQREWRILEKEITGSEIKKIREVEKQETGEVDGRRRMLKRTEKNVENRRDYI